MRVYPILDELLTVSAHFAFFFSLSGVSSPCLAFTEIVSFRPVPSVYQGHWGGIWEAPRAYSFVSKDNKQTSVELKHKFDKWTYQYSGISRRMPWVADARLTTSQDAYKHWYGSVTGMSTLLALQFPPSAPIALNLGADIIRYCAF